jgi:hypothetical protein
MKIFRIPIYFFSLLLLVSACGNQKKDETTAQEEAATAPSTTGNTVNEWPESGSVEGDTINIHGKVLVFYGPEREKATEDDQDFLSMSDRITASLEAQTDIKKIYTSASFIRIFNRATGKPMMVDRTKFGNRNGFLVTDGGQPPKMSNEGLSEEDCIMIIKTYFLLPS